LARGTALAGQRAEAHYFDYLMPQLIKTIGDILAKTDKGFDNKLV
jgi:hypothetical protein